MNNRRQFIKSTIGFAGIFAVSGLSGCGEPYAPSPKSDKNNKYNVLFICVDDMNDWTSGLKGYNGPVYTPNQRRLAKMGVEFLNAHTASPVCCPSRTAILTGKRPSTTGIYNNAQWWKPYMPDVVTLPVHFRQNGYYAFAAGKIHHHTPGFNPPYQWDENYPLINSDKKWFKDDEGRFCSPPQGVTLTGMVGSNAEFDWGTIADRTEDEYDDAMAVNRSIEFLKKEHIRPFFLACGTFRPHLPWYVPQKYIDMYPIEKIELPVVPEDDLDDLPAQALKLSEFRRSDWLMVKEKGRWKEAVQHYLASITFADAQIGRLLDALEESPHRDNTVIVFWSDHGWHLGEKHHFHKFTLWEEATRVPFIIAAPGAAKGRHCDNTVGLIDIYPTLIELCGLCALDGLDGRSLVPLLKKPDIEWNHPALTEFGEGQYAVRSQRWRYIHYSDGTEELYDHDSDENEWKNLADEPAYKNIKESLAKRHTNKWAPPAPGKNAYIYDNNEYSWTNKETGIKVLGK